MATAHPSAAHLVSLCAAARAWPCTPEAALFAAVRTQRLSLARQLLGGGTLADFALATLPERDWAALALAGERRRRPAALQALAMTSRGCSKHNPPLSPSAAGVSADGCGHLSPLAVAVRQLNLEGARLLMAHGAQASYSPDGVPLLLHLLAVVAAGGGCAERSPGPAPPAWHAAAAGGGGTQQPAASSSQASCNGLQRHSSSGDAGASSGGAPAPLAPALQAALPAAEVLARLQALERQLQLEQLLLQGGSDPLEPAVDSRRHTFLAGERVKRAGRPVLGVRARARHTQHSYLSATARPPAGTHAHPPAHPPVPPTRPAQPATSPPCCAWRSTM